jgi:hypothetical protein
MDWFTELLVEDPTQIIRVVFVTTNMVVWDFWLAGYPTHTLASAVEKLVLFGEFSVQI